MKKFFTFALAIFLLLATPFVVCAREGYNTYYLEELGLQLTVPDYYSVITRDTPDNDPIFGDLEITKSELISKFESDNIYLNALCNAHDFEIVVTMTENDFPDFCLLSDTTLENFASTLANQYVDYGFFVTEYSVFQHSQTKFIKLCFKNTDAIVCTTQYYTVYDGKAMNFTIRSYEIGSYEDKFMYPSPERDMRRIVESIKYDKEPPVAEPGEDVDSFVFADADSSVTFTVPENWKQVELSKDREFVDVKFASTKEEGCTMTYGSVDVWEQMSASDRVGHTRSDINNSAFTKADIAAMYNTTEEKISTIIYNGVEYFKCEITGTYDFYGIDITVKMTQLLYIDNGWLYMFQFGGTSTHKLYSDFVSLLNSIQYPSTFIADGDGLDETDYITVAIVVVALTAIVAIIVAFLIVLHKKKVQNAIYIPAYNVRESQSEFKPIIYCTKCGQAMPDDSVYCHKCGKKVFREDIEQ